MSLLQAFEKLLASLIILAMLVLILFLAFDNDRVAGNANGDRFDARYEEAPGPRVATRTENPAPAAPTPAPAPQAQNGQQPPAPPGKVSVPDPGAPPPVAAPAPAPAPPPATAPPPAPPPRAVVKAPETEAPKLSPGIAKETVTKIPNRLRKEGDPGQKSASTTKTDLQDTKLRRTSIQRQPRTLAREDRAPRTDRRDTTIVRTDYQSRWDRNHYDECTGGECSCDCNRPYWSQSGACSDY